MPPWSLGETSCWDSGGVRQKPRSKAGKPRTHTQGRLCAEHTWACTRVRVMLRSALSSHHYGPWFAILSQEQINRLGSVGKRRICPAPVPSAHMSESIVQIQLAAHTQRWPYLVHLLRFLLGSSVAPGSRGAKPNRFDLEPATPQIRII